MNIYLERDNGEKIELKEIQALGDGETIVVKQTRVLISQQDIDDIEQLLSVKTGKRVVVLPAYIDVVGMV